MGPIKKLTLDDLCEQSGPTNKPQNNQAKIGETKVKSKCTELKGSNGYSIDLDSNELYYIVKKDGVEFVRCSKKNSLADIAKHFNIIV